MRKVSILLISLGVISSLFVCALPAFASPSVLEQAEQLLWEESRMNVSQSVAVNLNKKAANSGIISQIAIAVTYGLPIDVFLTIIIRTMSNIMNIFLMIMAIGFVTALYLFLRSVDLKIHDPSHIKELPKLLRGDPSQGFLSYAKRETNGTYTCSYGTFTRYYHLSKNLLKSTIVMIVTKGGLLVLLFLLLTNNFAPKSIAQASLYGDEGRDVRHGDVLSYLFEFDNNYEFPIEYARMTIPLDDSLVYVSGSGEILNNGVLNTESIELKGGELTFYLGAIPPGSHGYVRFDAHILDDSDQGDVIVLQASFTGSGIDRVISNEVMNSILEY